MPTTDSAAQPKKGDGLTKWRAVAIVVNFVSAGYVLLPYGEHTSLYM